MMFSTSRAFPPIFFATLFVCIEAWSTRTYCCHQDGCNSAPSFASSSLAILAITMVALLVLRG